ncbi:MLO-like protein 6 isoform X2 [Cicer arietinum]|uniref:MLO-like protein n=1 Tax=Cicer arietinum TaxID=3827 RepID=A0A3Q7Y1L9_CICAR|nr:MLO-like protein 6 isoform X4 [Cicer arietinum]
MLATEQGRNIISNGLIEIKKNMAVKGEQRSLEDTPTWAVSVCSFFVLIVSLIIEAGLHKLTEHLKKKKRISMGKALAKTKTVPISKICINKDVANSFLPCNDSMESEYQFINYCEAKGKVSLLSSDGILQLNIFISFLAVFHILFCTFTMCLGKAKMRRWKKWEDETQTLEYQIDNDSRRFQYISQTLGGKRHLKLWNNYSPLLWMVCFMRQFYNSVSKDDYFALRNGFIVANISMGSNFNFNFKKFLSRTFDEDFEKVVGIRFWIWFFSILLIFLSAHEFYNYYWLPFIPLVVALLAGTKLQMIITNMHLDSCKQSPVIKGTILVRPSDEYFWFHRPEWLLHIIKLILIQNSFQLAFFTWTWYEFGPRSCFNREKADIAIRIALGLAVQLLCGYVTLPLYTLVTQMGSNMRKEIFTERVVEGLKSWQKKAKRSLSKNNSTCSRHTVSASLHSKASENSVKESSESMHNKVDDNENMQSITVVTGSGEEEEINIATNSSVEQEMIIPTEEHNAKIITRGIYDGEISFGSSWKNVGSSRSIREIVSIAEEEEENEDEDVTVTNYHI